ncbi:hypothetical protein HPB50_011936 [Hyalomma asiaticum]|uniref:Uncharacterized protein n=1 Tax=Hyalomma asiaticum TaxID=266040 RepID=A0ACB7SVT2_HYAAI|nr:hypothetical protein HPB50_011936 [Hyalomma asiaticum]
METSAPSSRRSLSTRRQSATETSYGIQLTSEEDYGSSQYTLIERSGIRPYHPDGEGSEAGSCDAIIARDLLQPLEEKETLLPTQHFGNCRRHCGTIAETSASVPRFSASQPEDRQLSTAQSMLLRHCTIDADVYDLCHRSNAGYYYNVDGKCRHTSKDKYYYCIDSLNKHSGELICNIKCVENREHDYCDVPPRFFACTKRDMDVEWWFYKEDIGG